MPPALVKEKEIPAGFVKPREIPLALAKELAPAILARRRRPQTALTRESAIGNRQSAFC